MAQTTIEFIAIDRSVFDRAQVDTPDDRPCILASMTERGGSGRTVRDKLSLIRAITLHASLGAMIAQMLESSRDSLRQRCRELQTGKLPDQLITEPTRSATAAKQKFQKFYAPDEFRAVLNAHFHEVRQASLEERDTALVMVCRRPRRIAPAALAAALRFEFELKIDDVPLGRSAAAERTLRAYLVSSRGAASQ